MNNYKKPKPGKKKPKMSVVNKCGGRQGCIVTALPYMQKAA